MHSKISQQIVDITQASAIIRIEEIQPLWNNYGHLSRLYLSDSPYESVIIKHIQIPRHLAHPKGFSSTLSQQRKIRSYQVETHWYLHYNNRLSTQCPTPKCLASFNEGEQLFLLLEDLNTLGYGVHNSYLTWAEIELVITWLAHFHASFMNEKSANLWSCGTYWHLATRPEELSKIVGSDLHTFASFLDARLSHSPFLSIVHGDAKLANFCFKTDQTAVAAVDFQYVGQGCGMKDLAYFVGSCMSEVECESQEDKILNTYFEQLSSALPSHFDHETIENEWRSLYRFAWADFQRFMLGWSPSHRKLTGYSERVSKLVIDEMIDELLSLAELACRRAGEYIQSQVNRVHAIHPKGFETEASDIVTEVDIYAQKLILDTLEPSIHRYNLGLLAEEGPLDQSRLSKHAFWAVDPLDGTQYFIEGKSGYAVSIALVHNHGQSILGAVYDPVAKKMYKAVRGRGVTLNETSFNPQVASKGSSTTPWTWFADRSLSQHPYFEAYQSAFDIRFIGGAVINSLQLLNTPKSMYFKAPKPNLGGCAIWDLAAVALILEECHANIQFYDGQDIHLNREKSIFFNDVGLALCSSDSDYQDVMKQLQKVQLESKSNQRS